MQVAISSSIAARNKAFPFAIYLAIQGCGKKQVVVIKMNLAFDNQLHIPVDTGTGIPPGIWLLRIIHFYCQYIFSSAGF